MLLFKRTLLAAAVAGLALPVRAAEPEPEAQPETASPLPKDPEQDDKAAVTLQTVRVEDSEDSGMKAGTQTGATKMPLELRETPQAVTVITRDSLDNRQVMTLGQALEMSAGVTQYSGNGPFSGQPSFGFNQTTIRGIDIDSLYDFREDGFVNGSYFAIPDLAIYDSVEVIKGPNSVMYGRGSVGGLINRVRKRPQAEGNTSLELSAGSFDTYRADLDTTGPLFSNPALRGRLVAAYEDSGSYVRGVETQRTVVAPSIAYDITPHTRLLLQALYQSEDIVPNTGTPLRTVSFEADGVTPKRVDAPDIDRRRYVGVVTKNPYTWTTESATAELEQDIGDQWLAKLRLNSNNIDTPIKVDAYAYGFDAGYTAIIGNDFHIDRDVWSGELQVVGNIKLFGRPAEISFGADHSENQYSRNGAYTDYVYANIYDDNFPMPDRATLAPGFSTVGLAKSDGAYLQAHIRPTDRLGVLLGARYDSVDQHSTSNFSGYSSEQVHDTTGRIALTYDLSDQVTVYTLYAQSFQPEFFATDKQGNFLEPETGEIYELGSKTEWFDGKLGVNAAIYQIDREHIPIGIDADPTDPESFPYSIASGLQRAQGYEIEINGRPLRGWDLSLAFNRVDPDKKDGGLGAGATPDWQLGVYSAYELQSGPLHGLGFGATYFAIDERGAGFSDGKIPGYKRIDLHASYTAIRNIEVRLVLRNLTDERYIEGADRSSGYATFGSPTAALLSVRYSLPHR